MLRCPRRRRGEEKSNALRIRFIFRDRQAALLAVSHDDRRQQFYRHHCRVNYSVGEGDHFLLFVCRRRRSNVKLSEHMFNI